MQKNIRSTLKPKNQLWKEKFILHVGLLIRATGFPIALLVNFGTWSKAQIERYYYHDNKIKAF